MLDGTSQAWEQGNSYGTHKDNQHTDRDFGCKQSKIRLLCLLRALGRCKTLCIMFWSPNSREMVGAHLAKNRNHAQSAGAPVSLSAGMAAMASDHPPALPDQQRDGKEEKPPTISSALTASV